MSYGCGDIKVQIYVGSVCRYLSAVKIRQNRDSPQQGLSRILSAKLLVEKVYYFYY